jgi:hypothetical protein
MKTFLLWLTQIDRCQKIFGYLQKFLHHIEGVKNQKKGHFGHFLKSQGKVPTGVKKQFFTQIFRFWALISCLTWPQNFRVPAEISASYRGGQKPRKPNKKAIFAIFQNLMEKSLNVLKNEFSLRSFLFWALTSCLTQPQNFWGLQKILHKINFFWNVGTFGKFE